MTPIPFVRTALPVLLIAGAALPAAAESWSQERAIDLASQLEQTLERMIQSSETAGRQQTAMQQRTRNAAVLEMRNARDLSREYAAKLRGGWSQDDSEPFFNQLRRATRQARERARDAVPDPKVAPDLELMDALLLALADLYERE